MKKKGTLGMVVIMGTLLLTGCGHEHMWQDANCTTPKTCTECGETEGEVLGHTWIEASCSAPKNCSVCGMTEGESLAHNYTEANYQQPATCVVCGATDGEPLIACYEETGVEINTALDTIYEYRARCYRDEKMTTTVKIMFTNYKVFDSDETHPAKEGYEWKQVDVIKVVGDENANAFGYNNTSSFLDDYYDRDNFMSSILVDENGTFSFTVNMNGVEYKDCIEYESNIANSGWENNMKFGWQNNFTLRKTINLLVPKGYDGIIYADYNNSITGLYTWEYEDEDIVFFRFVASEDLEKGNDKID